MIKVAVISDIHANIDALDATLFDIESKECDLTVCTGDIVGYHTFPDETVKRLMKEKVVTIRGNHDNDVVNKMFNINKTPDIFRFTYDNLSEESLEWLSNLPFSETLVLEGTTLELHHGSPTNIEEYLFEDETAVEKYAQESEADILCFGHTHIPWSKQIEETFVVNSGSVGKPKIGKPVATWAEITVNGTEIDTKIHEVIYDVERVATAAEENGFEKYAKALRLGRV